MSGETLELHPHSRNGIATPDRGLHTPGRREDDGGVGTPSLCVGRQALRLPLGRHRPAREGLSPLVGQVERT